MGACKALEESVKPAAAPLERSFVWLGFLEVVISIGEEEYYQKDVPGLHVKACLQISYGKEQIYNSSKEVKHKVCCFQEKWINHKV